MPEVLNGAGGVLARLLIFGPLVYVGLFMIVDPGGTVGPFNRMVNRLCRAEAKWFYLMESYRDPNLVRDSAYMRTGLRLAGTLIAIFGLSYVAGLA